MTHKFQVIYLTGAPATGKSSLCRDLVAHVSNTLVLEYGSELTKHASRDRNAPLTQSELRKQSSSIVSASDVREVDEYIIAKVNEARSHSHVILDSHAVTKESYGYRMISFDADQLRRLGPTFVVCLYTDSDTVRTRINVESLGRPELTEFEADFHTNLQSMIACTYGVQLSIPVYFLDSAVPRKLLVDWLIDKLQ